MSINGLITDNEWRIRYNYELYDLYEDVDIITFIKVDRLKWAGHAGQLDQQ
jgi:hypothetical protein